MTDHDQRMLIDGELVARRLRRARSTTSTRPPRRCSARSPTRRPRRCTGRSTPPGGHSTRRDWSTDRAFRQRCLEQLQEALEAEREEFREELIREVGCPRMTTMGPQLDAPLQDALSWPAKHIDEYGWEVDLPDMVDPYGGTVSRRVVKEAGRRGRRDHAVELPARGDPQQARSGARDRQHRGPQARTGHAVQRDALGRASLPSAPTSRPGWSTW